ncbi:hypothetical protein ACFX1Q_030126 [Malus domestica]
MSTSILHSHADLQIKKNAQLFFTSERALSAESLEILNFFPPIIPLQTSHTRVRISHIIRVKSKSIPYHAFSLYFPLALFLPARQGEKEQSVSTWNHASSQELTTWNSLLITYSSQELTTWNFLLDYLPGIAFKYSSSTSYASRKDTTCA